MGKKHILVIDDDAALRETLQFFLENANFHVQVAEGGEEGIHLASTILPDIVICDIKMDKMDGYSFLERLRKDISTTCIPTIMMTSLPREEAYRQCMLLGADDYLEKPFTEEQMLSAIDVRIKRLEAGANVTEKKLKNLRANINRSIPMELRTPLGIMITASEYLLKKEQIKDDEELNKFVTIIYRNGHRLIHNVENIILLSRLELWNNDAIMRQKFQSRSTYISESNIAPIILEKSLAYNRRDDFRFSVINASSKIANEHFERMLIELVDNAFKFSEPKSIVTVKAQPTKFMFELSVSNIGSGMQAMDVQNVGAYMQFDREVNAQAGMGLGLTIVKRIVGLYGGTFDIESNYKKHSTTIIVQLPLDTD